jgi:hypothetical protein
MARSIDGWSSVTSLLGRFAVYSDLNPENRTGEGALLVGDPSDYSIDDPQFEAVAPFLIQDADATSAKVESGQCQIPARSTVAQRDSDRVQINDSHKVYYGIFIP